MKPDSHNHGSDSSGPSKQVTNPREGASAAKNEKRQPKYPKPKILLVDMDDATEALLNDKGFRVRSGSFGAPYSLKDQSGMSQVLLSHRLPPNFGELEIVAIELHKSSVLEWEDICYNDNTRRSKIYVDTKSHVCDPRPLAMATIADDSITILKNGGVLVVFMDMKNLHTYFSKTKTGVGRYVKHTSSTWCFLSVLDSLRPHRNLGREIVVTDRGSQLGAAFARHLCEDCAFLCTFGLSTGDIWQPLARSKKYDNRAVAAYWCYKRENSPPGLVLAVPQVKDKARFMLLLLTDVLPRLCSHLFPGDEKLRWTRKPEYELPHVLRLQCDIEQVNKESKGKITALQKEAQQHRAKVQHLHDILTQDGDELKEAVKKTLEDIGFTVTDVDKERQHRREDLRLQDTPLVLVEVKGSRGTGQEVDHLAVATYIAPRMKEIGSKDIHGLTILNHERYKEPLHRKREPFTQDVVCSAEDRDVTLMTTWELYRLARSFSENAWKHEFIKTLFLEPGRFKGIPSHYRTLGIVGKVFPKADALGIDVSEGRMQAGKRVGIELHNGFVETVIRSLRIDDQEVSYASAGQSAGVQIAMPLAGVKQGMRVYLVGKDISGDTS